MKDRSTAAAVFLSGLMFGLVPLLRGRTFFHWDNAQQHFAQTAFLHAALRRWTWPQWWPDVGMGVPTLAEGQSAHLDPIRVAFAALFSPSSALCLEVGTYLGLAGVTAYFFMREIKVSPMPSLFGAFTHMFGGLSIVFVRNVALHRSLWVLPLLMLLAERISRGTSVLLVAGVAGAFGLQILSGHPTFAIVSAVSASIYLVVRVVQDGWDSDQSLRQVAWRAGAALLPWIAGLGAGLAVGAAQLLPTLLHVPHSIRAGGLDFEYATKGLTAGLAWMGQMVMPYAYALGDLRSVPTVFGSYFNQNPNRGFYLGSLTPILVLIALVAPGLRKRATLALVVSLILTFGLALGGDAPLFPALRSLPGLDGLRYPERFLAPCSLLLAAIAAIGFQRVVTDGGEHDSRRRMILTLVLYPIGAAVAAVLFLRARGALDNVGIPARNLGAGLIASLALVFAATSLAFVGLATRPARRVRVAAVMMAFMLVDLLGYRAVGGYARTADVRSVTAPSPAAAFLQRQPGDFRVVSLQSADGGTFPNDVLRDLLVADLPSIWGIHTTDVYFSLMLGRNFVLQESLVWELNNDPDTATGLRSFLGALNVRYVVTPAGFGLPGFRRVFDSDDAAVWENPTAANEEFLVYRSVPEIIERRFDWEARASMLRLPRLKSMLADWEQRADDAVIIDNIMADSLDFSRVAVVGDGGDLDLGDTGRGEITLVESAPDGREYQVETDRSALFVWSQSYYPGWRVLLDGRPAELYRADYVLMGVKIPPGSHRLSFSFRTRGLTAGLAVSVASMVLLLGLVWRERLRRENSGASA